MDIVVVGKHGVVDARLRALTIEKVERVNKFASDVRRIIRDSLAGAGPQATGHGRQLCSK